MTGAAAKSCKTAGELWRRNGSIWAALMVLLALTLGLAYVPMGKLTTVAGIAIALIKAGLVAFLFMELIRSKALIRLAAVSGLVFVTVLFALTLADVLSRLAAR